MLTKVWCVILKKIKAGLKIIGPAKLVHPYNMTRHTRDYKQQLTYFFLNSNTFDFPMANWKMDEEYTCAHSLIHHSLVALRDISRLNILGTS